MFCVLYTVHQHLKEPFMQSDRKHCHISRLNSVTDIRPRDYLLSTIFKEMQQGNATLTDTVEDSPYRTLAEVTERARELRYQRGNKEAYDLIKLGMPQFIPAAVLSTRSDLKSFSHLVCLEWDGDVDTAHALVIGKQHPNVLAIWRSLSGNPKFIVPISPVSMDGDELSIRNFKHAWHSVSCMFEEIGDPDASAMSPIQPQALCYDPDLFVNWDASSVGWDIDEYALEEAYPNLIAPEHLAYAELPVEYHIAIQEMDWRDDGVGKTRVPCPWESHENDRWESRSNGTRIRKHGENDFTFYCYKCPDKKRYSKTLNNAPQNSLPKYIPDLEPITALPHDHPSIANAPPVEVRETPSFRHFSEEERIVAKETLGISPDAGWHGPTPIWTPKYEYLHPLTNKFARNGQPSEVERRRVFSTLFGRCDICGGITAKWIDRYLLTAGFYCDGCHTDYPLGSYLELELNRKLPNSIISDHHGFLGENPDFLDFRLFQPGTLTHLGAGMGTGKTTEIVKVLVSLAEQGLGRGIIAVPRVALAQQLAYQLRWQHGHEAWGLYTEGTPKGNKFLGKHGAIVCLPSLQQAVDEAEEMGIQQIYVAIDELDFSYELLSLNIAQATGVKKVLRDALNTTGLVVAGQTESTLALEAFAKEVECEEVQAFYNTAMPADGRVVIKEHAADTNINALLASGIDDIADHLRNGQNVYSFCASRRDGEILAEEFSAENPVLYNAYTRGETRAHELLRYQRLTDSNLFIGTSAAGVGISFLDKKAVTIIIGGLIFGSRHANMAVQKAIRDRGRRGVLMHYKSYNLSLPMRPTENRDVSLYHETLKAVLNTTADINLPAHAVTKLAAAQALASLADVQFSAFLKYHLNVVGNMEVVENTPITPPKDMTEAIRIRRTEIRNIENELKIENAKRILNSLLDADIETQLLTSSEIRKFRNQGRFLTDEALANKLANEAARAVGWDDAVDRFEAGDPFKEIFTDADIDVALALVERNFDFEAFNKKRAGYLAVNAPKWTEHRFETDVQNADRQLTLDGLGIEITAVKDYRFLGELLKSLLDRLVGTVFEEDTLATTVKAVLNTKAKSGKTFRQELTAGALGTSEYRKARFLHCAEDEKLIVDWVARFISEWYPARLAKREDFYALQPDTHAELYLKAFGRWLHHQPDVFDGAAIQLDIFEPIEMPEANAAQKEIARGMRTAGATLKAIADELGVDPKTIHRWCRGVQPTDIKTEVFKMYTELDMKQAEIASHIGKGLATVNRWLKKMGADTKKQQLKAEVFRLCHEERKTQAEIEALLPLNQATISRWLTQGNS